MWIGFTFETHSYSNEIQLDSSEMTSSEADPAKVNRVAWATGEYSANDNVVELPEGLKPELMPKHVAVIMDGNRRWARERGLPVNEGHRAGGDAMTQLFLYCKKLGVKVLTVFAFSTENWRRPQEEVDFLMTLFEEVLREDLDFLHRNDIQVTVMGNKHRLPESLQSQISIGEEILMEKEKRGLHVIAALNYSGRYDITEASKRIATKVRDGDLCVEEINERVFEEHLELGVNGIEYPDPDLLIRTSGEQRISNFMLWQMAYTELYFSNKLFPDFGEDDFIDALKSFQRRQRRFGGHKYPSNE